jgi:hypothetical protein
MFPSSRWSQPIEGTKAISNNAVPRDGVLSPTDAAGTAMDILSSSGTVSIDIPSGETSASTLDTMVVVVLEPSEQSTESAAVDDRAQGEGHNTGPKLGGVLMRGAETGTADVVTTRGRTTQL